jgi:hypothetical protein
MKPTRSDLVAHLLGKGRPLALALAVDRVAASVGRRLRQGKITREAALRLCREAVGR